MADFCQQCSIETFGKDYADFKNLSDKPLPKDHGWTALCEGCGPTLVDQQGKCIAASCKLHGKR